MNAEDTTLHCLGKTPSWTIKLALSNKYSVLGELMKDPDATIEDRWTAVKETFSSTRQEVLGPNRGKHKDWISADS